MQTLPMVFEFLTQVVIHCAQGPAKAIVVTEYLLFTTEQRIYLLYAGKFAVYLRLFLKVL